MFVIYLHVEPVAQAKVKRLSENDKSLSEKTVLVNKKVSFGHNGSKGWAEDKFLIN